MVRRLLVLSLVLAAGVSSASGDEESAPTSLPATTTSAGTPPSSVPRTTTTGLPVDPASATVLVTPTGVVAPVIEHTDAGYLVTTPCGGQATVASGTPLATADVVLDAGHGGDEDGAVGPNGLREKEVNLSVVETVRDRLTAAGYAVVLTRSADYRMTLNARADVANALGPRAFVSVHHNAEPDGPSEGPGSETYYQLASTESKRLAGLIYEEVVGVLSHFGIDWVADRDAGAKYRTNSRGGDYYGILRQAAGIPTVLAESAFISNAPEAELLAEPGVREGEADAIADALVRYLTTDNPGSGFVEPYPRTDAAGPGGGAENCVDPPLE